MLERIKKHALSILGKCKRAWEWSKQRRRNMIISIVGVLASIAGLVLFFYYVFPTLLAVVILALIFWPDKPVSADIGCSVACCFKALALQVLESAVYFCNPDPIFHQVKDVDDVVDWSYIYDGETYKYFLAKKEAVRIDPEKLSMLGYKFENRINKRLRNVSTRTICTFDNMPPQVGVLSVEDKGGRVELSIFIANNPAKRKRLALLKQEQQKAETADTADVDKTDDDF